VVKSFTIPHEENIHLHYVTTTTLNDFGIFIHKTFQFVFCHPCGTGVFFEKLINHFRYNHEQRVSEAMLKKEFGKLGIESPVNSLEDKRLAKVSPLSTEVEPVASIAIKKGFCCKHCFSCFTSKRYMILHVKETHGELFKTFVPEHHIKDCLVQTIFKSPVQYFKVNSSKF
jgi:hypothetical protein